MIREDDLEDDLDVMDRRTSSETLRAAIRRAELRGHFRRRHLAHALRQRAEAQLVHAVHSRP